MLARSCNKAERERHFVFGEVLALDRHRQERSAGPAGHAEDFSIEVAARCAPVTANAALAPLTLTPAPGARVRLRLANAATARVTPIGVVGVKSLIVAVDG